MAPGFPKWRLRPAWRLAIAIGVGLALTIVALVWPAIVWGDGIRPVITQVEVTSSKSTFFYSPALGDSGGTVFFNNLSEEGADQIITVTLTVSDSNPITFTGGYAFGITPTTNISTSHGLTSTWSVTYTIRASDTLENGILFTITDADNLTDTVTITFAQDIDDPVISSPDIVEDSDYLYAVGSEGIYYGALMAAAVPFTVTGSADDSGVGLDRAAFSSALGDAPADDLTPAIWTAVYTADSGDTDQGDITVTVYDRVGNSITQTFAYTRDNEGPGMVFSFAHTPDADSGGDGFAPYSAASEHWEDELTADFSWADTTSDNEGGSGIAGYRLTSSAPVTTALHTTTSGSLTVVQDGIYDVNIRAQDNVGNLSGTPNYVGNIHFDREAPTNGNLSLQELSGAEYLHIADDTAITTGTLFYNNPTTSSFRVIANTPSGEFGWGGDYSQGWKVAFSPAWGESDTDEVDFPPFDHTYTITPSATANAFTVHYVNKAGNVLSIPIDAELDNSGPVITFTSVTTPDWDNGGIYWYRTGGLTGGWDFVADVTNEQAGVAPEVGWAYWDHVAGTDYDQSQAAPGGDGTFAGVSTNPDGVVTITVVLTDQVNNAGSESMTLNLDGTSPVITPTGWSISSEDYLHIIGDELFFSHMMPGGRPASLGGSAADNPSGSGLHRATFSEEPNLAGSPSDDFTPDNWFGSYTFASDSTQGDGLAVVTIYDRVGNATPNSFTYTEDATPPVVTYTGVTLPGYDPDGDPFNDTGNWYTWSHFDDGPGNNDWEFDFEFSDSQTGPRSASADWDHSNDGDDQSNYSPPYLDLGLGIGSGIFGDGGGTSGKSIQDDEDGIVTVTVRIEDNVGNQGLKSLILRIDNATPTISSGSWSENSPFLHADDATLYFSHQMTNSQPAALTGTANDGTGSGVDSMGFSNEPNLAGSPGPDNSPNNWSGDYIFDSGSSQGDGTVLVTLDDFLGNQITGTYSYVLDTASPSTPTLTITTPPFAPGYYDTRIVDLSWDPSTDNFGGSGLQGYYLDTIDPPSGFYSPTVTVTSIDTGADGIFTFYLEARDHVGNVSLTSTSPITVDTQGPNSEVTAVPEEPEQRFLVGWSADDATTWPVDYDVQYRINGGDWTSWLSATTVTSQYFGPDAPVEVETGVVYEFRARARDYVGNEGAWSAPAGGAMSKRFVYLPMLVRNFDNAFPFAVFDGFEAGSFIGWKTGGALPFSIVPHEVPPPDGTPPPFPGDDQNNFAARLGSPDYGCGGDTPIIPVGQAFIAAYAYVPAPSSGTPYLRYHYRVLSYDSVRDRHGVWWDRLEVQVNGTRLPDQNGTGLGDSNPYGDPDLLLDCSDLYDSGWQEGKIDLSAYAGQVITLSLFNENHGDNYFNTYSYLDNIRIEVLP